MKKKGLMTMCVIIAMIISCMAFFTGCGGEGTQKEYTIQYTDDSGTHQITVTSGMPYSMESVPEKTGYTFAGLFDAEVGGTQYVSSSGASLSPFTDGKNMVLFPQFKAKEYTLVLDYQGAAVTGSRSVKVEYDSQIGDLPLNLTLEHKTFQGWYTEPNRQGSQIADQYGVIPENNKVTEKLFDLSDPDGNIKLYAGFKGEEFTVTFYVTENGAPEEVKVEYGTAISDVQLQTRVDNKAVLTWSKKRNDTNGEEIFNGKVTGEMVLYAVEFAPVIDFDSNGGSEVNYIVARAGSTIALPTPSKDMAKFAYWEDAQGNEYTSTTMPSKSITLKAVWNAKIIFDSNGGSDVDDISVAAGEQITLPAPEKEGYIFAGWYTAEKDEYTSKTMPSTGIKLKAGWYKAKEKTFIVLNETDKVQLSDKNFRSTSKTYSIDLNDKLEQYVEGMRIMIELHFQYMNEDNTGYYDVTLSSSTDISSVTLYWEEKLYANGNTNYQSVVRKVEIQTTSNALYLKFRPLPYGGGVYTTMKDLYYTIHYPDVTTLYL